jgi:hypothetical protein
MLGTLKTMVSLEGIATLAKLEHLQEFLYESRGRTEEAFLENQQYFAMCMQVLPNLWVSCSRTSIHLPEDRFECYDFSRKAFQQKQAPPLGH